MIGTIIQNRYKITEAIAEGTYSILWKGLDLRQNSPVAAKILKKHRTSAHLEDVIRFKATALALSRVRHPNIVSTPELLEFASAPCIIMEYISGKNLRSMLQRPEPLDVHTCLSILVDLCRALSCAHGAGIIHRDIKPSNVIIEDGDAGGGRGATLIDFGCAHVRRWGDAADAPAIIGTFHYMAPEQIGMTMTASIK